jgi:NAD(P)-dependent dehydrogenase (short-subunit alcohol dehydrogenase family)
VTDLTGKVAVVTGGNAGIGKETARELAGMGAHVVIAARNPVKADAAVAEIRAGTGAGERVETMPIDLASFAKVRAFVDQFTATHHRCDILVNNAGLIQRKRSTTEDGHEMTFGVNHLGHFLLTNLLHDTMMRSAPARVVNVASEAHKMTNRIDLDDLDCEHHMYRFFRAYARSKLANILFTRELAVRWADIAVTANAVHPGFVGSQFAKEGDMGKLGDLVMPISRPFSISVEEGAQTSVFLASSEKCENLTGEYWAKCLIAKSSKASQDMRTAAHLWEISAAMTGVTPGERRPR